MKKKHYILIAVSSYFLFLFATIPAKPITDLINNNTPANILGVSGTLWDGKAYAISINNHVLKKTHWSLSAWQLLIGRASADISGSYLDNPFATEIGVSVLGNYFVNNLSATISAVDVTRLANIPLAKLSGNFAVDIEHAQWSNDQLPSANGVINWSNAQLSVTDTVLLGNVNILLGESEQDLLIADISNKGGDLIITGTAQLLPESSYTIDLKLKPTATASDNVTQSLGMFAKQQNDGSFALKNSGSLKQYGY